jgi:hypothetical protein
MEVSRAANYCRRRLVSTTCDSFYARCTPGYRSRQVVLQAVNADALCANSRKYLKAPQGMGFLFVRRVLSVR